MGVIIGLENGKEILVSFFRKLFGEGKPSGSKEGNPPANEDVSSPNAIILNAIRQKLLPFNFKETKDGQYPASDFRRGKLHIRWTINMQDEVFVFIILEGDRQIKKLRSPWYIEVNETAWGEFREQVFEALDDWLKTI